MSTGGKGSYDTEFSINFRFWDILIFLFFLTTEKLSDSSKNFLLCFGIREVCGVSPRNHLVSFTQNGQGGVRV